MGNAILTIVFKEAEVVLDSAISAAVNELHNLGHTVKEVRIMNDSGETKVALNTVAGVTVVAPPEPPAGVDTVVLSQPAAPATTSDGVPIDGAPTVVLSQPAAPATTSDGVPIDGAPVDTTTPVTA